MSITHVHSITLTINFIWRMNETVYTICHNNLLENKITLLFWKPLFMIIVFCESICMSEAGMVDLTQM
jgi:hypothetical protein